MKLLIVTEPDDRDALAVKLAMEQRGHDVRLFFTADLPSIQKNSVYLSANIYCWKSTDNYLSITDNQYEVVWWRRPRKPYLPREEIHPEDQKFVLRENSLFFESITDNIAPDAFWVNRKEAATRANSKLYQLRIAALCGLETPLTLCSNDPEDIKDFIANFEQDGVIYKPLCSNYWFEENALKIAYTSKIHIKNLSNPRLLQLTPGIYQKEIKKKYELRVVCLGDYLVAVKINSQLHEEGLVDWRALPYEKIVAESYQLPGDLKYKIQSFMKKMGLVFGSLDLIVTTEGDYVFLEVNEQGQFLWIEECCPKVKILDMFIHFLLNKSACYTWNPLISRHDVDEHRDEIDKISAENMQRHVYLNNVEMQYKHGV